jgi:hypothetical protein
MIRIHISAAAYAAILNGRAAKSVVEALPAPGGGFYLWLFKPLLERLSAARGANESYSDAILRLASETTP